MLDANDSDRARPRHRPQSLSLDSQHADEYVDVTHSPAGQIQGLEDLERRDSIEPHSDPNSPMHIRMPGVNSSAELALAALQYLPTPLIILSSMKTVVLANEAMGRLLHLHEEPNHHVSPTQLLAGKSLSQVGIDMIQDGRLLWVTWDTFLEELEHDQCIPEERNTANEDDAGDITPTAENAPSADRRSPSTDKNKSSVYDSVVEVVITTEKALISNFKHRKPTRKNDGHVYAKMIITIWELEGEKFYSLSFTSTESSPASLPSSRGQSRTVNKSSTHSTPLKTGSVNSCGSSPSSVISGQGSTRGSSSSFYGYISPTTATSMSSSPFPPLPPPHSTATKSQSVLQKMSLMKDALLDNIDIPILAMWKDESLTVPNLAARRLFHPDADISKVEGFELVTKWKVWNEDFTEQLEPKDYPISYLVRTQQPFQSRKVGMYDPDNGRKIIFDVRGEAVRDENGEFLAGIVACIDITNITKKMQEQAEKDEQRFELICDTSPQLIWTALPDGSCDWFSKRWYEYTGLTEEQSVGYGWQSPFHPADIPSSNRRWKQSLATGEHFVTEYRCRSKEGEWRWMLGRALPLRNKRTNKIEKWFGSCTDIHEAVESRQMAKMARQQLLSVLGHAQVTIFSVDRHRNLTLLEGAFIWDLEANESGDDGASSKSSVDQYIGKNVYEVLGSRQKTRSCDIPNSLRAVEDILTGKTMEEVYEHVIDGRSYRTRFVPLLGKTQSGGRMGEAYIDGVIGVSMDITELKDREAELQTQEQENARLLANEAAAKEASRLKSQFLANMSHEIRTPIAGVIGMAELLTDMNLNEEQQECAENIQRSANGLLTVINDILDFSKVESGRLDIEEVQFSLSVVVRDVSKMMGFVAERKNLLFESNIAVGLEKDLIVMGDPGRVRQIITNLLTNSIKFTSEGSVKFSVLKERETAEIFEVKFVVEDSGIGIEEEVRKRLFKPFSQADSSTARRYGGTGLGLTICKNLVDLMHGRITLESSLGNGTTASFWIPFNKPQFHDGASPLVDIGALPDRLQSEMSVSCNSSDYAHDIGTPPKDGMQSLFGQIGGHHKMRHSTSLTPSVPMDIELPMSERKKIEILVVEDNQINQKIATKTIQKLGFQVKAVWNGKEALDYLLEAQQPKATHRKPNIILMDVQMPVIDGYRASHIIRHHTPYMLFSEDVPIVAMTASAIQGDREKCKKAGMDDYLAKPVKGKTLEKMLVKWTMRKRVPGTSDIEVSSECWQPIEHEYVEVQDKERPGVMRQISRARVTGQPQPHPQTHSQAQSHPQTQPHTQPPNPQTETARKVETLNHGRLNSLIQNEGERAVRRSDAEDQAVLLRNEKLIDAAGSPGLDGSAQNISKSQGLISHGHGLDPMMGGGREGEGPPRQKLTIANMEKLEKESQGLDEVGGGAGDSAGAGVGAGDGGGVGFGDGDGMAGIGGQEEFQMVSPPSSMMALLRNEESGGSAESGGSVLGEMNGTTLGKVRPSLAKWRGDSDATVKN